MEHDHVLLVDYLRALAETGDLNALVESFQRHLGALEGDHRLLVQSPLIMVAFCGHRELAARLVQGGRGGSRKGSYRRGWPRRTWRPATR